MSFPALSLARAHALASAFAGDVRCAGLPIDSLLPLGGLRRCAPAMDHVVVLAVAAPAQHRRIIEGLSSLGSRERVRHHGPSHVTIGTRHGDIHVHLTVPAEAGAAMAWHTGASAHVAQLQVHGAALDLPFIPPEMREGTDEVLHAARGELPALVSRSDLRGDLHCHSDWSDGRDPVDAMVGAAAALGHAYVAVTDHSQRSASHRTLRPEDIPRQRRAIDAARTAYPGIHVFHGIEVDIMPDGSLDFDDDILQQFDIVLASLHEHAGQTADALLERYLRAADHPLVSVLTHPANRVPGRSEGYPLDFDRLFTQAARTGTAVEVDGGPSHLDLDGPLARRAAACGATLVIDSDTHRTEALEPQLRFGVGTARRGWVQASQVLNARPLEAVLGFIAAKRRRPSR